MRNLEWRRFLRSFAAMPGAAAFPVRAARPAQSARWRTGLGMVGLLLLTGPIVGLRAAESLRLRPNVVVLLSDDQGYGDLSCHGNPILKTPNLDKLHDQGVCLIDFHVAPMCSPTRGQLMTGVDCLRNGAMATCLGRHLPRAELPMMPGIFAAAGYRTGLFGKWHLGNSYPYRPEDRGFQETVTFHGFGLVSADEYWCNDYFDPWHLHNGRRQKGSGYCTDFFFDRAMAWMDQCRQAGKPFFAYVPVNAPHFPHWVDEKYSRPYEAKGPASFYGQLANLDENVGRLDAFLHRTGLYANTLVIFMSDNGYDGGVPNPYNAGMRGGKCQRYDGGHRVPCFVRWPGGKLQRPSDVDTPAQVQDILPTLTDLCHLPMPAGAHFDGVSLAGLLRGQPLPDRMFVVQYYQSFVRPWDAAVVWGRWRLVFGKELYDIRTDPGQQRNVAAQHPDVLANMRQFYETWWAGVERRINDFSPLHVGAVQEPAVRLTCCEWQDVRADGAESVRDAAPQDPGGGPWNVLVEREGNYHIELCRWPREANLPLAAGAPVFHARAGTIREKMWLVPAELQKSFTPPPPTLPRKKGGHLREFFDACKGGAPAGANFDYSAPLTEAMLVGLLAAKAGVGKKVEWDAAQMKCKNMPELNRYVSREYRKGWE